MIEEYMMQDATRAYGVAKRLAMKTKKNPDTGCIEWTAKSRANGGYGTLCVGRRGHIRAHRAAWVLANGLIPNGIYVCHKCDNPLCCNVEHLFLGTPKENMLDKTHKGRGTKPPIFIGENHHNSRFTAENVRQIRKSELGFDQLASIYNVSSMTIRRIKKRKAWKHVTDD